VGAVTRDRHPAHVRGVYRCGAGCGLGGVGARRVNLQNPFRSEVGGVSGWINEALDHILARISAVWDVEHKNQGGHGDVTADSLTVTSDAASGATGDITADGDVTADGAGVFGGDVIANNDTGAECGIGSLFTVNGATFQPGEVSRKGLLLGGVTNGMWLEQRAFASPFTSGYELRLWNLPWDSTTATIRIGILGGVPTLMDGGTGSTAMNLGAATRPLAAIYASNFVQESGTWIPALKFGGAAVGITYSTQAGAYSVFGDVVIANFRITLTNKGSSVGTASITGLPYASADSRESAVMDYPAGMTGVAGTPFVVVSASTLFPSHASATVRAQLTDANFTNTADIRACIIYKK
jgi:hypothetical protein